MRKKQLLLIQASFIPLLLSSLCQINYSLLWHSWCFSRVIGGSASIFFDFLKGLFLVVACSIMLLLIFPTAVSTTELLLHGHKIKWMYHTERALLPKSSTGQLSQYLTQFHKQNCLFSLLKAMWPFTLWHSPLPRWQHWVPSGQGWQLRHFCFVIMEKC